MLQSSEKVNHKIEEDLMKLRLMFFALLLVVLAGGVFAQGMQTATLEGTVTGADGTGMPGVTVSVTSPALMGERTAISVAGGDYVLRGLPPGEYRIKFSLEGMKASDVTRTLPLGVSTRVDAKMSLSTVTEAITVTAAPSTVLESSTVGANIRKETVEQLPILRQPTDIASLSPGVTADRGGRATTPVAGQLSINGAMAYDNNFMVNGVNVQDNIFGNTNNLFVEDAIQETQVLTSGISAEYGHFTGGVLNVITKSGGNKFSGTFRDNLSKPTWINLTPFEKGFRGDGVALSPAAPHTSHSLSNVYEGTLGGPIMKDRLWFFVAGHKETSSAPASLALTGIPYTVTTGNNRPEYKLTGNIGSGHTLQVDYIDNPVTRNLEVQVAPLTLSAVGTNSVRENRGYTGFYSGVLTTNVFAEARYSKKHFGFRGLGGTLTDIPDSPIRSSTRFTGVTTAGTFNAPYFDATDPEDRNNRQAAASLSYFLSTANMGSHDLKGGYEQFVDERTGGNSQTATSYVFFGAYKNNAGVPVLVNGELIPTFSANRAGNQDTRIGLYIATRGAKLDTTTNSFYINDRWNLNSHLNFNIGGRYEKVNTKATGGLTPIDTSNFTPRLGASFDPKADGKYKFDVTYAQYVGRYNPALTGATTPVGNPALLYGYYTGPAGEGKNFAPGFDPKNYHFYYASVPTANVFVRDGLHAPVSNEVTLSAGMALPKSGWAKATFTNRKFTDFIEDFIRIQDGCTNVTLQGVSAGCADNKVYDNSNGPKRLYQAADIQAHYDLTRSWGLEGNWTHQFKNSGNYEGEAGQTIAPSAFGNRPEIQDARELTTGRLAQFEADRFRVWSTYNFNLGRFGSLGTGLLFRYDSGLTYSYSVAIPRTAASKALNPGYTGAGSTATIIFGDRGAGTFNSTSLFDTSLQWNIPISVVTPWIKFDIRNLFNDHTQIAGNTTICTFQNTASAACNAGTTGPVDSLGYATSFNKSATFGRPTASTSYVSPRQYLIYAGVRF
jgi:outer membrane receptor protein involved in Fe transport